MVKTVLAILAVIACPFLWTMIIVPLIAKSFGVPIKIWGSADQSAKPTTQQTAVILVRWGARLGNRPFLAGYPNGAIYRRQQNDIT
jgi:hypothetical protein